LVGLLDEGEKALKALRVDVHHVCGDALQHADEFFDIDGLFLGYGLLQVPVHILMQPVLIPYNGVVLVELALDDHSQNLAIMRQCVVFIIFRNELSDRFSDGINRVVQVLVYDFDDGVEDLFLFGYLLLTHVDWRAGESATDHAVRVCQDFVQDCGVFLEVKQALNLVLDVLHAESLLFVDDRLVGLVDFDEFVDSSLKPDVHCDQQLLVEAQGLRSVPHNGQNIAQL